jgi:hypothetical protein
MQQLSKRTLNHGATVSMGSVQKGYLEHNWSDSSNQQLAVGSLQVNARRSEQIEWNITMY